MKLIIASNNLNKIREIKNICSEFSYEIVSLKDEKIDIDVLENGKTIEENSFKKANEIYKYLIKQQAKDFLILSDDSGLMIEYLNNQPGVMSARFAGESCDDNKNNDKVLELLKNVEYSKRNAKFLTVITLMDDKGNYNQFSGEVNGIITEEKQGKNGFGYDCLFYVEEYKKTFAELTPYEKNSISHRGRALFKLKEYLK